MMHGVEVRCPFLDSEIINFAFGCRWGKNLIYFQITNLKKILRDSVSDIIPENLLNAPKEDLVLALQKRNYYKVHGKITLKEFLIIFPE